MLIPEARVKKIAARVNVNNELEIDQELEIETLMTTNNFCLWFNPRACDRFGQS